MRRFLCLMGIFPLASFAGPIARDYASGFDGIAWGDSLTELVAKRPGGDHYFAVHGGERDYSFSDEKPLFGIARDHMRIYYFFDKTGSVISASITFPYEQRSKLLGALTLSYGPYSRTYTHGISTFYGWPRDDGTALTVEATLDPVFGMMRLIIMGPNSLLEAKEESKCDGPKPPKGKQN